MSEERLQEIKDSINLQYKVQEANDLHSFNIFTDEEQELVEEIERLNNILDGYEKEMDNLINARDKAIEYIEDNYMTYKEAIAYRDGIDNDYKIQISSIADLIDILKGTDKQ